MATSRVDGQVYEQRTGAPGTSSTCAAPGWSLAVPDGPRGFLWLDLGEDQGMDVRTGGSGQKVLASRELFPYFNKQHSSASTCRRNLSPLPSTPRWARLGRGTRPTPF